MLVWNYMGRKLELRLKTKVEKTRDRMETPCPFLFPYPQIPINIKRMTAAIQRAHPDTK